MNQSLKQSANIEFKLCPPSLSKSSVARTHPTHLHGSRVGFVWVPGMRWTRYFAMGATRRPGCIGPRSASTTSMTVHPHFKHCKKSNYMIKWSKTAVCRLCSNLWKFCFIYATLQFTGNNIRREVLILSLQGSQSSPDFVAPASHVPFLIALL